ncbi:MAG: hypothetical protein H6721_08635 [Sandaracinus sp.]|nr:hypothetical protein [Myxococcales bacterium]MCB9603101.1 hypothetical protein [Sandaracinus sp.]MCB9632183.1 hypothetical protein [Sandaracinus sp.]
MVLLGLACGGTHPSDATQSGTTETSGAVASSSEVPAHEASATDADDARVATCPIPTLEWTPDAPLDEAPPYDRATWVRDALFFADVVARARGEGDAWVLDEVFCGAASARLPRSALRPPHERGSAIRALVRTASGYVDVSPDGGLRAAEWEAWSRRPGRAEGDVEVEGATVARQFADAEESWRVRVTRFDDFVRLEIENRSEQPVLQLQLYAEGLLGTTWRPTRGRGYRVDWRRGAIVAFDQEIDRRREGLARYYDFDHERPLEELRFRAGRRHGVQRRFEADGTVHETVYEDGFVPPVVAPRRRVDGTRVEFRADGSVVYEAPAEIVRRLRVGWTVQRVADVLGQPISEAQGVLVPGGCTPGVRLELEAGRVVSVAPDRSAGCMDDL